MSYELRKMVASKSLKKKTHWIPNGIPESFHERHGKVLEKTGVGVLIFSFLPKNRHLSMLGLSYGPLINELILFNKHNKPDKPANFFLMSICLGSWPHK